MLCVSMWRPLRALAVALFVVIPQGCKQATQPEEIVPPATVKWQGASENALEEWTELVGTSMALPDRIARVTASIEGRVTTVLTGADGKPVVEGQRVDKGTVLVQLDDAVIKANLAKLKAMSDVLDEEQ